MLNVNNEQWIQECKECILIAFPVLGQEYIDEAEHQEGKEYWMQFENISEVLQDVHMYYQMHQEFQLEMRHCLDLINGDYAGFVAESDQPFDIKENFQRGLVHINTTFGRLYK